MDLDGGTVDDDRNGGMLDELAQAVEGIIFFGSFGESGRSKGKAKGVVRGGSLLTTGTKECWAEAVDID